MNENWSGICIFLIDFTDHHCEETAFMKEFELFYGSAFSRESLQVMEPIFLSLFFAEMLVVVDLGVDVHDDDEVGLGWVSDGNANNVLSMDADEVLNDLGMLIELVGPDGFLFVSFDVLKDDGSATEVNELGVGDEWVERESTADSKVLDGPDFLEWNVFGSFGWSLGFHEGMNG